jgi:hypothetical protein
MKMRQKFCIDQPGSLGDILFSVKIAHELSKIGEVYWRIAPTYWQSGVSRIEFPDNVHVGPEFPQHISGATNLKLTDLTERHDPNIMTEKYRVAGVEWEDWASYLKYKRNPKREKELQEFLGIEDGDKYIVYNEYYGLHQIYKGVKQGLPENYEGKLVELKVFNEATIFDWCAILENAEEIHTVDTSIQYVIETLNLPNTKLVVHPRHYKTTPCVSKLFKKPWQWMEVDKDTWRQLAPDEAE